MEVKCGGYLRRPRHPEKHPLLFNETEVNNCYGTYTTQVNIQALKKLFYMLTSRYLYSCERMTDVSLASNPAKCEKDTLQQQCQCLCCSKYC